MLAIAYCFIVRDTWYYNLDALKSLRIPTRVFRQRVFRLTDAFVQSLTPVDSHLVRPLVMHRRSCILEISDFLCSLTRSLTAVAFPKRNRFFYAGSTSSLNRNLSKETAAWGFLLVWQRVFPLWTLKGELGFEGPNWLETCAFDFM